MKLKDLIQELQDIARDHGEDTPIYLSDDEKMGDPLITVYRVQHPFVTLS